MSAVFGVRSLTEKRISVFMEWIFLHGMEHCGRRAREEHYEYAYRLRWLRLQMDRIGFRNIRFFGDRTMAAPGPIDERVFITAIKE